MNNKKRMKKLKAGDYHRLFEVKKETFDKIMEVLEKAYTEKHKKGGKPPKLTVLDKLIITLQYYRGKGNGIFINMYINKGNIISAFPDFNQEELE